jgi:hypothetical protein
MFEMNGLSQLLQFGDESQKKLMEEMAAQPTTLPPAAAPSGGRPAVPSFAPQQAQFTPRDILIGDPVMPHEFRQVKSREEEVAALAQDARIRSIRGASQMGVDPRSAQQLGQQSSEQFLQMLGASDQRNFLAGQNEANRQAAAFNQQTEAQSRIDAARESHSPQALRGAGTMKLMEMLARGDGNPRAMQEAFNFLNSMPGNAAAAGATPAAPGAAPAVPGQQFIDAAGRLQNVPRALQNVAGALGAVPNPETGRYNLAGDLNTDQVLKMLNTIQGANLNPEEYADLARDINSGKVGDANKIREALARNTAGAYLRLRPPVDPTTKRPINVGQAGDTQFPFQYDIPIDDKNPGAGPLMQLGIDDKFQVGGGGIALSGGIPYNVIRMPNGVSVPVTPDQLRGVGRAGILNSRSPQDQQMLAGGGDRLFRALMGLPPLKQ